MSVIILTGLFTAIPATVMGAEVVKASISYLSGSFYYDILDNGTADVYKTGKVTIKATVKKAIYKGRGIMDKAIMEKIELTMKNLQLNKMKPYFVEKKEDVLPLVKTLVKEGDTVSNGGSVTLKQTGVMGEIKSGKYNYLDRSREGITPEEIQEVYRQTYGADVYFASSNAITENGELYNVDGNSNRVSAILYGPKSVVLVCGYNKIVKNIDEAVTRVKTCCAPPNAARLDCDTYCAKAGQCVSINKESPEIPDGCRSERRICCNYVICAQQRHVDRIKVIIVGEELGY